MSNHYATTPLKVLGHLTGVSFEPTTFGEMFWLRLWGHASVITALVPVDLNIYSSHMRIGHKVAIASNVVSEAEE